MKIWNALSLGSILIASAACRGQAIAPPALPAAVLAADPTPAATTVPHAATAADTTPVWQRRFDRWVRLDDMTYSMRYRSVFDSNNAHEFNQGQSRSIIDGRFKFDAGGKYAIAVRASSGHYFNWAYADFTGGGSKQALRLDEAKADPAQAGVYAAAVAGAGTNLTGLRTSGGWSLYVRRFYLDVEPVKGAEGQYGSLDIDRGVATEITTYDYDGYLAGERLLWERPSRFVPDEVSVTYGYLGDIFTPNFFARGERLAQNNYHQFLVRKDFAKTRFDSSFDYTWQNHAQVLHEALLVKLPESRVVDSVRAETYQRLNLICYSNSPFCLAGGDGYAVTLDKKVGRLSLEGGYADIDQNSGVLTQVGIVGIFGMDINGDQYGIGKRGFGRVTVRLTPYLEASGFYTHLTTTVADPLLIVWNKQALNAGVTFDIKKALFPGKPVH